MIRFILTILASSVQVFCSAQNSIAVDSSPAKSQAFVVTLLGTGTPQPLMDRFGPGILVQAGTETLVFDADAVACSDYDNLMWPIMKLMVCS